MTDRGVRVRLVVNVILHLFQSKLMTDNWKFKAHQGGAHMFYQ